MLRVLIVDAAFHTSKNRPNETVRSLDKRSNGWQRRQETFRKKSELLLEMLQRCFRNGIDACGSSRRVVDENCWMVFGAHIDCLEKMVYIAGQKSMPVEFLVIEKMDARESVLGSKDDGFCAALPGGERRVVGLERRGTVRANIFNHGLSPPGKKGHRMRAGRLFLISMMMGLFLIVAAGMGSSLAARFEFADPDNETVSDNETGLVWQTYDVRYSVQLYGNETIAYCDTLTYAGHSDWRLPRIDELLTIVDYSRRKPASYPKLDNIPPNVVEFQFGSATIINEHYYYLVDVGHDGVAAATDGDNCLPSTETVHVRCVRLGPSWKEAGSRLSPITANTVIDRYSGRIWQQADDNIARNWVDANNYCQGLELDGYSDWRLPTVYELASIVDYKEDKPMLTNIFLGQPDNYWTSTYLAGTNSVAWAISFDTGVINRHPTFSNLFYVRCTRGGPGSIESPVTLTVTKSGSGKGTVIGTVTGSSESINFDDNSTREFPLGTNLILAADAESGSGFKGWQGGGCEGRAECFITLAGNVTVDAEFEPIHTISGKVLLEGTKQGFKDVKITLAEIGGSARKTDKTNANGKYVFSGVFDGNYTLTPRASFHDNATSQEYAFKEPRAINVVVNGKNVVGKNFRAYGPRALAITKRGSGSGGVTSRPLGIDCADNCTQDTQEFRYGTGVWLTAAPNEDSNFGGWWIGSNKVAGTKKWKITLNDDNATRTTSVSAKFIKKKSQ